jgi:hypothetical protein
VSWKSIGCVVRDDDGAFYFVGDRPNAVDA